MLVEFEQTTRSFGEVRALDGVSLQVREGITTAVIGESGCGKSTLLQHVNGLLRPDSGEVRVFGEPVPDGRDLESLRRRIGYAVQGTGLFPHLTAFQNVTLLARLEGWDETRMRERFAELCSLLELDVAFGERFPHRLSGGQQQRVGICRALMLQPKLVLLDEPFSAIDPITRRTIHAEFELARAHEGAGVLLVTHDMDEARRLAHELVIMRHGRIVQDGPIDEVLANPTDAYVARLVGGEEVV